MKGQVRTNPPEFLENELVIATLDGYGRLQTTATGASFPLTGTQHQFAQFGSLILPWCQTAPVVA